MLVSVKKGIDNKLECLKKRKTPKLAAKFYVELFRLNQESGKAVEELTKELTKTEGPYFFPTTGEKVEIQKENEIVLNDKAIVETLVGAGRIDDLLKLVKIDSTSLKRLDDGDSLIEKNTIKVNTNAKIVVKKMSVEELAACAPEPKEKKVKAEKPATPKADVKKAAGPKASSKKATSSKE